MKRKKKKSSEYVILLIQLDEPFNISYSKHMTKASICHLLLRKICYGISKIQKKLNAE